MKNEVVQAHLTNKKITIYLTTDFDYGMTSYGIHELNNTFDCLVITNSSNLPVFINPDKIYYFEVC
ncbi:hypothetical protein [Carnobacterium divergens]|uniref:hypothetical protein n=1 Tax=Carnobacterium divergens TaxID=2748 RepID=UPI0039B1059B